MSIAMDVYYDRKKIGTRYFKDSTKARTWAKNFLSHPHNQGQPVRVRRRLTK